jgi:cellulose synthase/poly-beta-1,6-N-acetylglucosamine synthase-like glycosyltransferase
MILFWWITGFLLAAIWLVPVVQLVLHFSEVADLTQPEWEPPKDVELTSLTIVVPARNEEAEIEEALRSLLQLNYPQYEIVAVNDRSTDLTGDIMERLAAEPTSQGRLRVIHVKDLSAGWLGKVHAMWTGAQQAGLQSRPQFMSDWILFTDADCVFAADSVRRAVHYALKTGTDHLVLFPPHICILWASA